MRQVLTVNGVIDGLGGTSAVARLTDRDPRAVSNWRMRKKLPAETFVRLSSALAAAGMDAPASLWGMEPPPVPPSAEVERQPAV